MPAYYLEIAVVVLGIALLMLEALAPPSADSSRFVWIAVAGLGLVFAATFFAQGAPEASESPFWRFYTLDKLALFYKQLALLAAIVVLIMAREYANVLRHYAAGAAPGEHDHRISQGLGEYISLPVFACAGLMWMASAIDLISIFVSLELTAMCFYILVSYMRQNIGSLEAGVKYLILGALSTGFLVYGMTWIFGLTGETSLAAIGDALKTAEPGIAPILFAFSLFLVGLGFKVGAVPFQIWIPDVYQGAPTPTTAFLSVGSKSAGFIVLLRVLQPFIEAPLLHGKVILVLTVIAGATILYGNLAAIPQTNFKRLLAYSSISHAGFLLMGIACWSTGGKDGTGITSSTAVSFYLAAYLIMTLLSFFVLVIVRSQLKTEDLDSFNGLGKRSPFLAFALLTGMVSLAGVPLTAGFFGKFFIFFLAVEQGRFILLAIAVLGAAAGFYYYFKIVRSMYWNEPAEDSAPPLVVSIPARITIVILIAAVFLLGIYPTPILNLLS